MKEKNDFVQVLKKTLNQKGKKSEWTSLVELSSEFQLNEIYQINKAFYSTAFGKKHNEKIIANIANKFCLITGTSSFNIFPITLIFRDLEIS